MQRITLPSRSSARDAPRAFVLPLCAATVGLYPTVGVAQTGAPPIADHPTTTEAAETWLEGITLTKTIAIGVTSQPGLRRGQPIFGHLLTDRNETIVVNQFLLAVERPTSVSSRGHDIGFRAAALLGTDARYTRLTGQFERATTGHYAFDIVEACLLASLAFGSRSGIDLKVGEYLSPLGYEILAANGNPFYSHGYIFNFGVPGKHAGALMTMHVNSTIDLTAGVDRGTNTSFEADNNDALAFIAGGAVKLRRFTITALTHIGPENPRGTAGLRPNRDLRYYNDIIIEWRVSDRLTSVTEFNYIRDDGLKADGGGAAQYLTYQLSPVVKIAGRAEIWRDAQGAFVGAFPDANDLIFAETGRPNRAFGGGPATYVAFTAGTTISLRVPHVAQLMLRPELRVDHAAAGRPFDAGRDKTQFTAGIDLVVH